MMPLHSGAYAEVIGDPIAQSKSPIIHNFWLEKIGFSAKYCARQVTSDQLGSYLASRRKDKDWLGCNVTMPLKQCVGVHIDTVDTATSTIGAVNTIYASADRTLTGTNTDAAGFLEPLKPYLAGAHLFRMARIIGTGGAARAIVAALVNHGFVIVMGARNTTKAEALFNEVAPQGDHHVVPLSHFAGPTDFAFDDREGCLDLIVNASPLGMKGQSALQFDFSHAPPGSIVYDIVTNPVETDFLKRAADAGFVTIDGLSMLIGQAASAFTLFFGAPPPREFDQELRERLIG